MRLTLALPPGCTVNCRMDVLMAAFPAWRGVPDTTPGAPPGALRDPLLTVEADAATVYLTVPDGTDPAAVRAVLTAHDHAAWLAARTRQRRLRQEAIDRAAADPALRDVLVGLGVVVP